MTNPDTKFAHPIKDSVRRIQISLSDNFGAHPGASPRNNIQTLSALKALSKFSLEALLSQASLISLNDDEYNQMQETMNHLIDNNRAAAAEQGIPLDV